MADSRSLEVQLRSDGETVAGFLARPLAEGVYPGVVVIQEWWGLVDHIKEICMRLARQGYVALAPDLFHGQQAAAPDEAMRLSGSLTDAGAQRDLNAAIGYLKGQAFVNPAKIGAIGFCMGGRLCLLFTGQTRDLAASAVWYGNIFNRELNDRQPRHPFDGVPNIACPLIGVFGEADAAIPMDHVNQLREALQRNNKTFEIYSYPGAQHAFGNDTNPDRYAPEATQDGWAKTLAFYEKHLKG